VNLDGVGAVNPSDFKFRHAAARSSGRRHGVHKPCLFVLERFLDVLLLHTPAALGLILESVGVGKITHFFDGLLARTLVLSGLVLDALRNGVHCEFGNLQG